MKRDKDTKIILRFCRNGYAWPFMIGGNINIPKFSKIAVIMPRKFPGKFFLRSRALHK